jgi:hypothetical protein
VVAVGVTFFSNIVAAGVSVGEEGAWVGMSVAVGNGIGVEIDRPDVDVGVGDSRATVGDGEGVIVRVGAIVTGAWTVSAPHAAIKNAARVNRTPAAELDLTNMLLFIRGGMIALNEVDVQ